MALVFTQLLSEMNTRNVSGGKAQPALKAHNLTAICGQIVYEMWKPRRLTNLRAFQFAANYALACQMIILKL
jgi:hypothetical protein